MAAHCRSTERRHLAPEAKIDVMRSIMIHLMPVKEPELEKSAETY